MVLALRSEFSTVYIDLSSSWIAIRPCSEHEMSPYKFLQLKFLLSKTVKHKNKSETENCLEL
jgi:hypothetical protein